MPNCTVVSVIGFSITNATFLNKPLETVSQIIPWKMISSHLPLPPQAVIGGGAMKQKATGWLFSLNSDNDNVKPGQCIVLPNMPKTYIDNSEEYAKRYRNCNPPFY